MGRRRREGLDIEYVGGLKEESSAFAGVGLLVDIYRQAGVGKAAERVLPQKRSLKGLRQGQMVEAFAALSSLGGGCLEDMERLRQDKGLEVLLGYRPPAPETARQWLDGFHDGIGRKVLEEIIRPGHSQPGRRLSGYYPVSHALPRPSHPGRRGQ